MENVTLVKTAQCMEAAPRASAKLLPPKAAPLGAMKEASLGTKLLAAGLAGCIADLMTFPLDTAKAAASTCVLLKPQSLQIQGEGAKAARSAAAGAEAAVAASTAPSFKYRGVFGTICTISREEGVRALYNGIAPGLQRQMAFCAIRIGLYDVVKNKYKAGFQALGFKGDGISLRIMAGITTGGLAVLCAQPTDVVKVRMQAQMGGAKRYTGCINAYRTIGVTEGVRGLWKGAVPNIARNAIVNACELVSYDLIKTKLLAMGVLSDNLPCHFVSAVGAGFVTTIVASPVDVVKTRFMNSPPGQYRGPVNCAVKMFQAEGFTAFYKGVVPSFSRLVSWNIVMFVCFEQLKRGLSSVRENRRATTDLSHVTMGTKKFL